MKSPHVNPLLCCEQEPPWQQALQGEGSWPHSHVHFILTPTQDWAQESASSAPLGLAVPCTSAPASYPSRSDKYLIKKKSTSGPSQDLRTDCQFQDSSDTPLALTQSLILSNPTLKPKGCLVYQGLPLYSGQNGLQNAPSTLCGWPRLQCLASTRESVFVQTRQPLDLLLFLVQPPKPAGRMPRGGSSRVTGSVPSLQDRSESHSLPRGRVSSCARISHI